MRHLHFPPLLPCQQVPRSRQLLHQLSLLVLALLLARHSLQAVEPTLAGWRAPRVPVTFVALDGGAVGSSSAAATATPFSSAGGGGMATVQAAQSVQVQARRSTGALLPLACALMLLQVGRVVASAVCDTSTTSKLT